PRNLWRFFLLDIFESVVDLGHCFAESDANLLSLGCKKMGLHPRSFSSPASSISKPASRSKTIFRMLWRFAILLSISWISELHIFLRTPIISNRWLRHPRSFFNPSEDEGS